MIAPSFADIFRNNSLKNGLLPVVLPELVLDRLFSEVAVHAGYRLAVDLPRQVVVDGTPETTWYIYDAAGQRVRKVWEKSPGLTEERIYLGGFEIFRRRRGLAG